jgi:hypothetical protein
VHCIHPSTLEPPIKLRKKAALAQESCMMAMFELGQEGQGL